MKELSEKDLENFTLSQADKIVQEYAKFLEHNATPFMFEDDLPWSKQDIILSFLKLLKSEKNKEQKEFLSGSIMWLVSFVIPTPAKYETLLALRESSIVVVNGKKFGLTNEEIIEKM